MNTAHWPLFLSPISLPQISDKMKKNVPLEDETKINMSPLVSNE